ncbi:TetR family transcriptional regulator [Amycolatopsis mediterranei S699]|uniref:TetR family transcriptional regulator n=2 Tax=Amycolatopsis mediterranei TaxID=33910 RepID=A0A0H3DEL6_AMYMU|nr:TetR family transcriptional regulator [Amycolatopsis mediterranei]ADJ48667.1 TetR family transcriptional regulator [Amycolatopsis mediterranei U32]AEK45602.1 TetR family transcriptional regulator [Amycolatopsis mediterranei S699]AFO80376.1 TetR family transcriptional regulator [Amycolatopsis mediterranei S699]AGT87504.1 TetR family transcriptional regulator [Amycolatopsis mediterranei RB]KDO03882.1 TetR family transcriptional regulator [Amycolatopsis mediterranei]
MPTSSSGTGHRPRSRAAAGLPALTADCIVSAATALTAQRGLDNWTLRELARSVEAYPAVIYHHVGDRDAVVNAVVDRVVGLLELPAEQLPWQEWFTELLAGLRAVLRTYPGCARRLALFGPSVKAATRTIDAGVGVLLTAGFGRESVLAYNLLLMTACQFVAMEDDRDGALALRIDNTEEYATYRERADLPGMAELGAAMHDLMGDPDLASGYYAQLYDYAVRRCLDGLTHRLDELRNPEISG